MSIVRSVRPRSLGLALLAAFLLLAITHTFWWGFGRDQAIFAWVGDTIVRGGVPYKDAWEIKGVATHLTYGLAQELFGRSAVSVRILDAMALLASVGIGCRMLCTLGCRSGAVFFGVLFVLSYLGGGYWDTAQTDGWVAMLQLFCLGLMAVDGDKPISPLRMFWIGAALALCVLHKPSFVPTFAILFFINPPAKRRCPGPRSHGTAFGLLGLCTPLAAVLLWLGYKGGLHAFWEVHFAYNLFHHVTDSPRAIAFHLGKWFDFFSSPATLGILVFAVVGLKHLWQLRPRIALATIVLLATDALAVVLGKWYFEYHFLPLRAVLCCLAGLGLQRCLRPVVHASPSKLAARGASRRFATITCLLVGSMAALPVVRSLAHWSLLMVGASSRTQYDEQFGRYERGYSYLVSKAVGKHLADQLRPGQTALMWTFDPSPLFFAGVQCPTRFGTNVPLTTLPDGELLETYREELAAAIRSGPPARVVVATDDKHNMTTASSDEHLARFEALRDFLATGYQLETSIGNHEIYAPNP